MQRHNDIVKDAGLVIDYYNANCLEQGETAKDLGLFSGMTVQAKEVVNAVQQQKRQQHRTAAAHRVIPLLLKLGKLLLLLLLIVFILFGNLVR